MDSRDTITRWSVFDSINFFPATPEALMAEINAAIAALEYAHASAILGPPSPIFRSKSPVRNSGSVYDAQIAEEAYRLGCAALSEGKVDEGLYSLNISLSKCPPDQTDAIAKIQSVISLAARHFRTFK
ncbi:hypothetical protein RND81_04G075200 [Saponaria officinalis]|uniref:Uncharacterized protein n=1 Tax=Saponaria officinalis TaxID=3572 RepID=A0AAW1KXY0_SAPOF